MRLTVSLGGGSGTLETIPCSLGVSTFSPCANCMPSHAGVALVCDICGVTSPGWCPNALIRSICVHPRTSIPPVGMELGACWSPWTKGAPPPSEGWNLPTLLHQGWADPEDTFLVLEQLTLTLPCSRDVKREQESMDSSHSGLEPAASLVTAPTH